MLVCYCVSLCVYFCFYYGSVGLMLFFYSGYHTLKGNIVLSQQKSCARDTYSFVMSIMRMRIFSSLTFGVSHM